MVDLVLRVKLVKNCEVTDYISHEPIVIIRFFLEKNDVSLALDKKKIRYQLLIRGVVVDHFFEERETVIKTVLYTLMKK